jgi:hypothetical protein
MKIIHNVVSHIITSHIHIHKTNALTMDLYIPITLLRKDNLAHECNLMCSFLCSEATWYKLINKA